jgi:hypothetical protein
MPVIGLLRRLSVLRPSSDCRQEESYVMLPMISR